MSEGMVELSVNDVVDVNAVLRIVETCIGIVVAENEMLKESNEHLLKFDGKHYLITKYEIKKLIDDMVSMVDVIKDYNDMQCQDDVRLIRLRDILYANIGWWTRVLNRDE